MNLRNDETLAWREGAPHPKGVSVEVAAAELQRLHERDNGLTAEAVLTAATPEDTPLHPAFEWDDAKAAREHRLQVARMMVRAVYIVRKEPDKPQQSYPAYVGVPQQKMPNERPHVVYRRLDADLSDADKSKAVAHLVADVESSQRSLDEVKVFYGDDMHAAVIVGISEALAVARELSRKL